MNTGVAFSFHFSPMIPATWLIGIGLIFLLILIFSFLKNRHSVVFRAIACAAFIFILLNPSLLKEKHQPAKDTVVIVLDKSPSQKMGDRETRAKSALAYLKKTLNGKQDLEVKIVEAPSGNAFSRETKLFESLETALADVPVQRRAGVLFITDGQVHDVPKDPEGYSQLGPVQVLLTGDKNEKDRQLVVLEAPTYGITGKSVMIRYKVEDTEDTDDDLAAITFNASDEKPQTLFVPVGKEQTLDLPLSHAGENIFELSVQSLPGEITDINNRAVLSINAVRDRLRVLLVSGQPYAGGRTWRDLLTSDPAVDLVHFTILREPDKLDYTPQNEMSLIAFPVRELFEVKLHEFDLIIFDRYTLNRILPENYFSNIAHYVEEGGAFLESSGPSFAGQDSLYFTALQSILPGSPTGEVLEKPYKPVLTPAGIRHPVTHDLEGAGPAGVSPDWGHWFRQIVINPRRGETLMNGADGHPLLVLDRVRKGRVAQIASDQIWLWSRGYDGGGPYTELLRRIVHWLMKEPALDEKAFDVKMDGAQVTISSRRNRPEMDITMTRPDGKQDALKIESGPEGFPEKTFDVFQPGIYAFEDDEGQKRLIAIGDLSAPEFRSVRSTPNILSPVVQKTGGGIIWLSETPEPAVRFFSRANRSFSGKDWIALRKNNDFTVTDIRDEPLLADWIKASLLLSLVILCWWHEGRKS